MELTGRQLETLIALRDGGVTGSNRNSEMPPPLARAKGLQVIRTTRVLNALRDKGLAEYGGFGWGGKYKITDAGTQYLEGCGLAVFESPLIDLHRVIVGIPGSQMRPAIRVLDVIPG